MPRKSKKPNVERNFKQLGRYITNLRERAHLSPEELATRLGVSPGIISRWQSGALRPTEQHMNDLLTLNRVPKRLLDDKETRDFIELWLGEHNGFSTENIRLIMQQRAIEEREDIIQRLSKEAEWKAGPLPKIRRLLRDLPKRLPHDENGRILPDEMTIYKTVVDVFDEITRFYRSYYKNHNINTRYSIGMPVGTLRDHLKIRWHKALDDPTVWANLCYIGPKKLSSLREVQVKRSLPGYVFSMARYKSKKKHYHNNGLAVSNVTEHHAFFDRHDKPHEMQYTSVVFAIIKAKGISEPLGQLAIDSPNYEFTDHDRELLTLIAQEFGILISNLELWTWPKDPESVWYLDRAGILTHHPTPDQATDA